MRTLEEIKGRCFVEVDEKGDEHWIWRGCVNKGVPWVRYVNPATGKSETGSTINAAWRMEHSKEVPAGKRIVKTCSVDRCVNPACSKCLTHAQWGKLRKGKTAGNPGHRRGGITASANWRVMTQEMVDQILASDESAEKLAKKLGFKSSSSILRVRRGDHSLVRARVEHSPFAGLMR